MLISRKVELQPAPWNRTALSLVGGRQKGTLYPGQKVSRVHRLREQLKIMPCGSGVFEQIRSGSLSGEQEYPAIGTLLLDLNCEVNPGKFRHDHVGYQEVRGIGASRLQGFKRRREGGGIEALMAKNHGQG